MYGSSHSEKIVKLSTFASNQCADIFFFTFLITVGPNQCYVTKWWKQVLLGIHHYVLVLLPEASLKPKLIEWIMEGLWMVHFWCFFHLILRDAKPLLIKAHWSCTPRIFKWRTFGSLWWFTCLVGNSEELLVFVISITLFRPPETSWRRGSIASSKYRTQCDGYECKIWRVRLHSLL